MLDHLTRREIDAVVDTVETWNIEKVYGREFTQRDMRYFIERMNALTRLLISRCRRNDRHFYEELFKLATNAQALTSKEVVKFLDAREASEARQFVLLVARDYSEFYTGLFELAMHACTLTTPGARVFGDGIDRTGV
jgi:hypothetical protein